MRLAEELDHEFKISSRHGARRFKVSMDGYLNDAHSGALRNLRDREQTGNSLLAIERLQADRARRARLVRRVHDYLHDLNDRLNELKACVREFNAIPMRDRTDRRVYVVEDLFLVVHVGGGALPVAELTRAQKIPWVSPGSRDVYDCMLHYGMPLYEALRAWGNLQECYAMNWDHRALVELPRGRVVSRTEHNSDVMRVDLDDFVACTRTPGTWVKTERPRTARDRIFAMLFAQASSHTHLALEATPAAEQLVHDAMDTLVALLTSYRAVLEDVHTLWVRRDQWPDKLLFTPQPETSSEPPPHDPDEVD